MALIMKDITKQYSNTKALDGVNIRFEDDSVIGLIGFNGSGKTTTFNILTNLIEKHEGQIFIEENGEERPISQKDRIGFSYLSSGFEPQNSETAMNQLSYIGSLHGLSKKETLERVNEAIEILEFDGKINKSIKSLSKGNQQKIKLIGVFINPNTKYILLDEPFDGLDPIMVEKIKNFILKKRENKTIIVTSHRMEVVDKMCDSFFILKDGILVDSKVQSKDDITILMSTNLEIPDSVFKGMKEVVEISKNEREKVIKLKDLSSFKKVNKAIISNPKYVWSSLKEKKLTESVFERYANEENTK